MRFTGIFTTLALAIGLTTALPATSTSDNSITSRAEADTYYTVRQFNAAVYPNTNEVFYYLDIKAHSPDANRRFGYSYCQVQLKANELVPVTSAICASDSSVYFQLIKYTDAAGAFAGWKLIVSHPYHEDDMLMVDAAVRRFPKDLVMTKGKGKGLHRFLGGPRNFNITVKGS